MKKLLLITTLLCFAISSQSAIKLPAILGNNMVLQQNSQVKLWGKAEANRKVEATTSWNKRTYSVKSDRDGNWLILVETPSAGGPYSVTISDGEAVTLSNVLIGEVWLCSGQSNMGMRMRGNLGEPIEFALDELLEATPANNIRLANITMNGSLQPLKDCETHWSESTPETLSDFSAAAYFFAKSLQKRLNVPIGVINSCWGGSRIESWIERDVFEQKFPEISLEVLQKEYKEIKQPRREPVLLYNAMIHPLENYTIKGAIWYQGEGNRDNPEQYKRLFPAMVDSWRAQWGQGAFPFYYVQIAPFCYGGANCDKTDAAEVRQAQLECLELISNSGMVVTADIGSRYTVHPSKKREVGQRLALWALANTYGVKSLPFSGPIFRSTTIDKNQIIVDFLYSESGLNSNDQPIIGFEVAGADDVFHKAEAKLVDRKTKVAVWSKEVAQPVKVRYAYKNYQPVNLFNNYGLPTSPFKSH